ncbi:MAG: TlpA disulfide reductase family protein [Bacillus sp. (in: firmicutes)]
MKLHAEMPELIGETMWLNGLASKGQLVGEKPTLIHFWSISCHICKETMPNVNELRDRYSGRLNVIAVHMPRSEKDLDIDEIKAAAHKYGITQPIFIDGRLKLSKAFDNRFVPAYYVFDKTGRLRHFQAGGSGVKMIEKRIERVLDEPIQTE